MMRRDGGPCASVFTEAYLCLVILLLKRMYGCNLSRRLDSSSLPFGSLAWWVVRD